MRLRPSPLVEAASTFALAFLVVLAWYTFSRPAGIDIGSIATKAAILVMFPIFTAMTLVGLAIRTRSALQRFIFGTLVTLVWSAGSAVLFWQSANVNPSAYNLALGKVWVGCSILVFISTTMALAVTYRFIVGDNKVRLSNTQYASNPSVSSKSNKRKKK
jgi:hypothetical protein